MFLFSTLEHQHSEGVRNHNVIRKDMSGTPEADNCPN
jgi:hypothetical protein